MKTKLLVKLAASSLILGSVITGCAQKGATGIASPSSTNKQMKIAAQAALQANKALSKRKFVEAVRFAEAAVAAAPQNANYRALLGQAYLSSGRFASAQSAFTDTLSLNPADARAALNLALAQIANGRNGDAIQTLESHRQSLSAADFGLALALAGDPKAAVALLQIAARDGRADVKLRQNLALSYALAGKWTNARVMAAQDLSPEMVDERMTQWAQFVSPKAVTQQVATLLGVKPVSDAGQPMRLALVNSIQQSASVESAIEPAIERIAEPIAQSVAFEPQKAEQQADAPVFEMAETPIKPAVYDAPLIKSEIAPTKQSVAPVARSASPSVKNKLVESGRFVVQLGAFKSSSSAQKAWNSALNKTSDLADYTPATSRVKVKAASLFRMSVSGFTTRETAGAVCAKVKSGGGACFIRSATGDAPAQWVQRGMVKVASR